MQDSLREAARAAREELVETTVALVRCRSETPPSDTRGTAALAQAFLAAVPGATVTSHPSEPPVMNLVARIAGASPGPRLVLSGHLDTYPAGDPAGWRVDPFGGDVADGRIYGRGAADMKGGIACILTTFRLLAAVRDRWSGELVVALAGDEESMGELGTQVLIDTVPEVRGDAVMIPDVGSPDVIRVGEKGMVWLEVEAEGTAAHGAHVHRGVNAADRLIAALARIGELRDLPVDRPPAVARTVAAAFCVSEPLGGPGESETLSRVTVNLGRIDAGTSPNLVPETARAALDIRLPQGVTVADVERALHERLDPLPGIGWRATRRYEPSWTDPDETIVRCTAAAAAAVLNRRVVVNDRVGASDARLFRRAGMPTVVCGLTPRGLGGPDEYLVIDELVTLTEIYALAAFAFLQPDRR